MASNSEISPWAIVVAAAVGGTMLYAVRRRRRRCTEFDGIWRRPGYGGGLWLTDDSIRDLTEMAEDKIKSVRIANDPAIGGHIALEVAEEYVDCDWEDLDSDKKKQVFSSIRKIVDNAIERIPPEGFGE